MDLNGKIAALLRDFAAVQQSKQKQVGLQARGRGAILALDEPIESLLQPDGTLRKIPNIGPSSTRIILEVLQTGTSPTIEAAIAGSGQKTDVERRRGLRGNFLSRAQVLAALRNPKLRGPSRDDYRGDLQMHSTCSDGSQTLRDIVEAGIDRGYEYCAVTDHSYGLPIARGVSMARARRPAPRNRSAEPDVSRTVPAAQGHRGEHPRRRIGGHDAGTSWRGSKSSSRRRIPALRSQDDQTARMVARRDDAGRAHPGAPARPHVRVAARRHGRMGTRVQAAAASRRRDRDRRRSRRGRTSTAIWRSVAIDSRMPLRARQRRAFDARSCGLRRQRRSRTRGWPAFLPSA